MTAGDVAAQRQTSATSRASNYSHNTERSAKSKTMNRVASTLLKDDVTSFCGCVWSKAAKTFMISLVLCTTITTAQVAGALIANSQALMADCVSMALDSVTYALNLFMECRQEESERKNRRNLLISSGLSFVALLGISAYLLVEPITGLLSSAADDDDVNPYIVLGFAVGGVLFDLLSLLPHFMYGCPCGDDERAREERQNLKSALSHTLADGLRSMTTLTESILILGFGVDPGQADAWATIIVLAIIIFGMGKPIYDWCMDLRSYVEDYGWCGDLAEVPEATEKTKLVDDVKVNVEAEY